MASGLGKAELPGWADWIIAAYVAFYVVIHLILSVSITKKKNLMEKNAVSCAVTAFSAHRLPITNRVNCGLDIRLLEWKIRKHAYKHVPHERSPQRKEPDELWAAQRRAGKWTVFFDVYRFRTRRRRNTIKFNLINIQFLEPWGIHVSRNLLHWTELFYVKFKFTFD